MTITVKLTDNNYNKLYEIRNLCDIPIKHIVNEMIKESAKNNKFIDRLYKAGPIRCYTVMDCKYRDNKGCFCNNKIVNIEKCKHGGNTYIEACKKAEM